MSPRAAGDAKPPRRTIDLNADIGESFGIYQAGNEERLLGIITSGSIACGYHAGDPSVMRRTVQRARRSGVAIGAHPGLPDLAGFGRRAMAIEPREVADLVLYQIGALDAIARAEGAVLRHVKPHGALYNMSVRDADIADAIAGAVASIDTNLLLLGMPGSELLAAGSRAGLRVAGEGFADRSYEPDGSLTPRHVANSVVSDAALAAERAIRMVRDGKVIARDGTTIDVEIETICVHGDTPGAAELAGAVREGLERAGVTIAAL